MRADKPVYLVTPSVITTTAGHRFYLPTVKPDNDLARAFLSEPDTYLRLIRDGDTIDTYINMRDGKEIEIAKVQPN